MDRNFYTFICSLYIIADDLREMPADKHFSFYLKVYELFYLLTTSGNNTLHSLQHLGTIWWYCCFFGYKYKL